MLAARVHKILPLALAVTLAIGGVVGLPARAVAASPLAPISLNNGFGADAKTQRTVTWLASNTAMYADPYIKVAAPGQSIVSATPDSTDCTSHTLTGTMTAYTAYTCTLTGLTPGTTYTYVVGAMGGTGGTTAFESQAFTFATEPAIAGDFTFLDFADSQGTAGTYDTFWGNTLRTAVANFPGAVLATHTGDLTNGASSTEITNWLTANGSSLAGLAFNPTMGNHDGSDAQTMWDYIFPRQSLLTSPFAASEAALQYAQLYGNALFLYVNTNMNSAAQLTSTSNWVTRAVNVYGTNLDGTKRFVIVVEHKSPFGGQHANGGSATATATYPSMDMTDASIPSYLPKVYAQAGVDLVLAGHDHNLLRSLPIKWNAPSGKATWDRAQANLTTINSDTDGLVYYIPRNSGEAAHALITAPDSTHFPWIASMWRGVSGTNIPGDAVYSALTVTKTQIRVNTYRTGSTTSPGNPGTPIDSFVITQNQPVPTTDKAQLLPIPSMTGVVGPCQGDETRGTTTAQVLVTDVLDKPIAGRSTTFSVDPPLAIQGASTVATGPGGIAEVTISYLAGTKSLDGAKVYATVNGVGAVADSPRTPVLYMMSADPVLAFYPTLAVAPTSGSGPVYSGGQNSWTATLHVGSACGVAAQGLDIAFAVSGGAAPSSATRTTDMNGDATVTITDMTPETVDVTTTILNPSGHTVKDTAGQPAQITFTPPAIIVAAGANVSPASGLAHDVAPPVLPAGTVTPAPAPALAQAEPGIGLAAHTGGHTMPGSSLPLIIALLMIVLGTSLASRRRPYGKNHHENGVL